MVSIADKAIKRKLFSVEDYHRMGEAGILPNDLRFELLNGEIIEMSPILSYHASCVDRLNRWFTVNYHEYLTRVQNPVTIEDHSEPEPDIVLARMKKGGYHDAHPTPKDVVLIIEVSDSSLKKDRKIKLPIYADAGIPETWIVNLKAEEVSVYTQPSVDGYARISIFRKTDRIISTNLIQDLPFSIVFYDGKAEKS